MNTAATKNFKSLLRKIAKLPAAELPETTDPVDELVLSFLLWESSSDKAIAAYARIRQNIVDFNDLRVSMPHETVEYVGERYPHALERAQRLRATLRDIYLREHCVSLERVRSMGKREIKKYVESLEGIVPYVANRVLLRSFDTHGVPVDEHLMGLLVSEKIADADGDLSAVTAWIARQVKTGEGAKVHEHLQAWSDASASKPARKTKAKTTRAPAAKTRTPKTKSSKAATAKTTTSKTTTSKTTAKKKTTTKKKSTTTSRASSTSASKAASKKKKKTASRS